MSTTHENLGNTLAVIDPGITGHRIYLAARLGQGEGIGSFLDSLLDQGVARQAVLDLGIRAVRGVDTSQDPEYRTRHARVIGTRLAKVWNRMGSTGEIEVSERDDRVFDLLRGVSEDTGTELEEAFLKEGILSEDLKRNLGILSVDGIDWDQSLSSHLEARIRREEGIADADALDPEQNPDEAPDEKLAVPAEIERLYGAATPEKATFVYMSTELEMRDDPVFQERYGKVVKRGIENSSSHEELENWYAIRPREADGQTSGLELALSRDTKMLEYAGILISRHEFEAARMILASGLKSAEHDLLGEDEDLSSKLERLKSTAEQGIFSQLAAQFED